MLKNKKKLIYLIIVILLIVIIATGTVLVIKAVNSPKKITQTTSLFQKSQADTLKAQAIAALKNNDTTKAKTLFQQADQQYKDLGDKNNAVDTEAQLYLIEHPNTGK
jgi:hypothetical protein